jgi:hypothetical protein
MNNFSNNLTVRALNHWRVHSLPTYLGLRLFLSQVPKSEDSNFLVSYLLNKISVRKLGRYRHFFRFKGLTRQGAIENRDMFAASPSTALAEAYALSILSNISSLQNKSYIYSNRWPNSKNSGRSYTYFYSGYRERNLNITNILKKNQDLFVVSNDLKRFYPSIDKQLAISKLKKHLENLKDDKYREFVNIVCQQLIDFSSNGVPIGPALSEVLASIFLENIDSVMYSTLKERYFRYVDDVLMVVSKDEIENIQNKLKKLVEEQGLFLNEEKYDVLTASEWLDNVSNQEEIFTGQQFEQLTNRIELYLWDKPNQKDELSKAFKEMRYAMPVQKFAINASYGRKHLYMKWLVNHTKIYKKILTELKYENINTLLSDTKYLSGQFFNNAYKIKIYPNEKHPSINKLRIQRLRYILNRLIYLTPFNDFNKLIQVSPEISEFYEFRIIINALIKKYVEDLINVPGPAVSTFASTFQSLSSSGEKLVINKFNYSSSLDSLATLLTFGLINPPDDLFKNLEIRDQEFINFCMFKGLNSRKLQDFSYEDELRTLQIGINPSIRDILMTTRFSDKEQINLDALSISNDGY